MHKPMTPEQKIALINNMRRFGGNFVGRLADAMSAADPTNFVRICNAFPEIVDKYSTFHQDATEKWLSHWEKPFNQKGPEWILVGYGHVPENVNAGDPRVENIIFLSANQNKIKQ